VREFNEESDPFFQKKLDRLAKMVKQSKYTVFFTGAGVSTSAGVGDYRGPSGAWTKRKIRELEMMGPGRTAEDETELAKLKAEAAREEKKARVKIDMGDAQPTPTHMAMATLIRLGLAHYVVTTNLDGIYRKAGLKGHDQLCCLHGDIYVERCSGCGYDFERNFHVRQSATHVHDHKIGTCSRCGSAPPAHYKGTPGDLKMKKGRWGGRMVGTRDVNCGTKDTHINFGELLDEVDWNEADTHCRRADLCIIAGTSMSLRHITHFPFMARQVVLINLQPTPDDDEATLRIWAKCDPVFEGLMARLNVPIDPIPAWRPRDAVPLNKIPGYVHPYYKEKARNIEEMALLREAEADDRRKQAEAEARKAEEDRMDVVERDDDEGELEEGEKKNKTKKNKAKKDKELDVPVTLEVGNTHEAVPMDKGNAHRWTMFVKLPEGRDDASDLAELVDHVTYDLHPTFSPAQVRVTQAPFSVTRTGWGTFNVGVTVQWKKQVGRAPLQCTHSLSFGTAKASDLIDVTSSPSA
jgi:NAD-dependent SIR2 family protein deacetylase